MNGECALSEQLSNRVASLAIAVPIITELMSAYKMEQALFVPPPHSCMTLTRRQKYIRTPWLDAYFVYTSSLGTHTFFMTVLPAFFFFGYEELGRGYVHLYTNQLILVH